MLPLVPLQFGLLGGLEMLVFLTLAITYGLPLLLVIGLFYYLRRIDQNVQRLIEQRED